MSGNGFKPNSNFLKKCISGVDDRISKLPDDMLLHILSFLTVTEVVVTSLVSRRWSHLWRYTPNLIFRNEFGSDPMINIPITMPECSRPPCSLVIRSLKNMEWVNSVLNSHKAVSLNNFSLTLYIHNFQALTKWLHFALSRQVKSLELDIEYSPSTLDSSIIFGSSIQRSFLKELRLANLDVSGEAVELFLCNCPLLERLFIENATLTSDLVVDGGALKHLKLQCRSLRFAVSTKVSAPNLTRLDCNYNLEHLFLQKVPALVEASIYLNGPLEKLHHIANEAAKFEILTIILWKTTAFSVPQMPKLNKLVLNCMVVNNDYLLPLPITCVLQASPCLREFILKISDTWMYEYKNNTDYESVFEIPEFGFSHNCLEVFEFSGFCGHSADHMNLLRYIVVNCVALREVTITTRTPKSLPEIGNFEDCSEYDFNVIESEMGVVSLKMRKRVDLTTF